MSETKDKAAITFALLAFYASLENGDADGFRTVTHPDVRTVNIGNSNEINIFNVDQIIEYTIQGLQNAKQNIPGFFARWEQIEIKSITLHDVSASAEVHYKMTMPESTGHHRSFIQLVQDQDRWQIIQITDRGLEVDN